VRFTRHSPTRLRVQSGSMYVLHGSRSTHLPHSVTRSSRSRRNRTQANVVWPLLFPDYPARSDDSASGTRTKVVPQSAPELHFIQVSKRSASGTAPACLRVHNRGRSFPSSRPSFPSFSSLSLVSPHRHSSLLHSTIAFDSPQSPISQRFVDLCCDEYEPRTAASTRCCGRSRSSRLSGLITDD
jgi:hypothetical protein